jgi:hypothetical protein
MFRDMAQYAIQCILDSMGKKIKKIQIQDHL